jgi:3-dehydroquinate dehydratase/shikimate dehydrogenase
MICISIAQESRRLALVDMHNASKQCDLLELRLDCFAKSPDIKELMQHKPKPIIFSCRRPEDGGNWKGSEADRLALLRQCIVSKAEYVEIELDVADQIRKFPPSKRVITYTNVKETPPDIADIYARAQTKDPDIIKLATVARAPEEAWPLLYILAKAEVPTVVAGLGKPGVMLSVLGKKIGAPWAYAALEKGMEAYPGQPTVRELEDVYHYRAIDRSTRFIGVTGFGTREYATVAVINALLGNLGFNRRCLPLALGSIPLFHKMLEAVRLKGLIVDPEHHGTLLRVAASLSPSAEQAQAADLFLRQNEKWRGYNVFGQAGVAALEAVMRAKSSASEPLQGRVVLIVGMTAMTRALACEVKERGGVLIIASHNRTAAQELAKTLECRHVAFEALYTTMHDVLVVCDHEKELSKAKGRSSEPGIRAGYLRPGMTVMDLTASFGQAQFVREAAAHGCQVVLPRQVLREQLALQARKITGKDIPLDVLDEKLTNALGEED